jgi:hypothetical protein
VPQLKTTLKTRVCRFQVALVVNLMATAIILRQNPSAI